LPSRGAAYYLLFGAMFLRWVPYESNLGASLAGPAGARRRPIYRRRIYRHQRSFDRSCWLVLHESGTFVRFTQGGAELFV